MAIEDEAPEEEQDAGAPAWVMTFADLMSLLMCFFVLLLAFSEMDVQKFKQLSGSMKNAFGVQKQVKSDDIPKGTSIVAQEFSPGIPQPTPFQVLQQITTDDTKNNLDFATGDEGKDKDSVARKLYESAVERVREDAEKLVEQLKEEIDQGLVEVEWSDSEITIRLRERGSFNSGEAIIKSTFISVLDRIADTLSRVTGQVVVAGHSDNVPIYTYRYRSNWDLSAARAAVVANYLQHSGKVHADRLQIRAHADTIPLVPNNTAENRALNRRVEIVIAGNHHFYQELNNEFSLDQIEQAAPVDIDEEVMSQDSLSNGNTTE